jgi:NADH dehydrogenase (ubiquinone) 1 alpha subcomplex subunit 9
MLTQSFETTKLHFYDGGFGLRTSVSGIRATIFGATGFIGPYVGAALGYVGSDLIFPHNHEFINDDEVKGLKLCAGSGQSYLMKCFNFEDPRCYENAIKNSNVVINLTGPRPK